MLTQADECTIWYFNAKWRQWVEVKGTNVQTAPKNYFRNAWTRRGPSYTTVEMLKMQVRCSLAKETVESLYANTRDAQTAAIANGEENGDRSGVHTESSSQGHVAGFSS